MFSSTESEMGEKEIEAGGGEVVMEHEMCHKIRKRRIKKEDKMEGQARGQREIKARFSAYTVAGSVRSKCLQVISVFNLGC